MNPYHVTCFAPFPCFPHSYQNCLLCVVAVGQSDSSESSHHRPWENSPRGHCLCMNIEKLEYRAKWKLFQLCVTYMRSIIFFDRSKLWIQLKNFEVDFLIWKVLVPWHRKSDPVYRMPVEWNTLSSQLNENIGVCVIFHMELRFPLHYTSSRKFYNTLIIDWWMIIMRWSWGRCVMGHEFYGR